MYELFNLLVVVAAIAGVVLAIGSRDKIRTLEFRLALIEKRLREIAAGVPEPAAQPEPPPAPISIATPEPAAPLQPAPELSPTPQPAMATSVPPSPPPPAPPQAAAPQRSFEERFGTQWVVWAAGFAIVIGGFLFLRYTVEAGWFGPLTRVLLGALLALALIAAGEWARRSEQLSGITGLPSAHIPSILTAAGTAIAYADVWAAYA
jgi:uncharacterized membrane protein